MLSRFDVDLPALIEVLSAHLYSAKEVPLRELIQNARDSLLQAGRVPGRTPLPPAIQIAADPVAGRIVIRDNGVGMTRQQAQENLSVLARSGTRLLRQTLSQEDPELAALLAGQFGLGFLSTMIIATRVVVRSRSADGQHAAIRWSWDRGASGYALDDCDWPATGTEVELTLSRDEPDVLALATVGRLEQIVRRYCDLVEFPILLEGRPGPINRMRAPWTDGEPDPAQMIDFLRDTGRIEPDEEPLFVGHVPGDRGYGGLLYLPQTPGADGQIALHVRHIFVSASNGYITPSLDFLHGIIDDPDIPLTLSRESVVAGEAVERLQSALGETALRLLKEARDQRPRTFRRVLDTYGQPLKMAALRDDRVMDLIADSLVLKLTSGQSLSLGEIATHSGGQIAFIDDAETQAAHGSLHAAQGKPVVDASNRLDWMVLQKYSHHRHVDVERADVSAGELGRPATGPEWQRIEEAVAAVDETVEPRAVELDVDVPALLVRQQRDVLQDIVADARRHGADDPRLELLDHLLRVVDKPPRRRLLLNVKHRLTQALAEQLATAGDLQVLRTALKALVASARAYSEPLDPAARRDVFEAEAAGLVALLACLGRLPSPESAGRDAPPPGASSHPRPVHDAAPPPPPTGPTRPRRWRWWTRLAEAVAAPRPEEPMGRARFFARCLQQQGIPARVDADGTVRFERRHGTYVIRPDRDGLGLFHLVFAGVWAIRNQADHARAVAACDLANARASGATLFVVRDSVHAAVQWRFADPRHAGPLLTRAAETIDASIETFDEMMKSLR